MYYILKKKEKKKKKKKKTSRPVKRGSVNIHAYLGEQNKTLDFSENPNIKIYKLGILEDKLKQGVAS